MDPMGNQIQEIGGIGWNTAIFAFDWIPHLANGTLMAKSLNFSFPILNM